MDRHTDHQISMQPMLHLPGTMAVHADQVIAHRLSEKVAELERENRDLDAFAREIAHEIRTPIGQVATIAELLLDRARAHHETDLCRWLELQLQAARGMADTVNDLLEYAHGKTDTLHREWVDVSALCEGIRADLVPVAPGCSVKWWIEPGMRIWADRALLTLLMRNLLSNALKYSSKRAHAFIKIRTRSNTVSDQCIVVEDNGSGFDEGRAEHLFEPFVRLHDDEAFQGTGVGLALVKRIVERHGGWIRAHSKVDAGATFEFALGAVS